MPKGIMHLGRMLKRPTYRKGVTKMARAARRQKARFMKAARVAPSRNIHSFRRGCNSDYATVSGTGLSGSMTFQLSDTLGYTEFDNLYDRYMITAVVLKVRLVTNPDAILTVNNNGGTGVNASWSTINSTNWYPRFFYCKDYDDSSAETLAQLKERARTKMIILKPNMFHKIVIRPAALFQTYYTTTGSAYAPKWNSWIDMAQPSMPHYGLKYNIDCDGLSANTTYPFRVELEKTYYFKCKDVR